MHVTKFKQLFRKESKYEFNHIRKEPDINNFVFNCVAHQPSSVSFAWVRRESDQVLVSGVRCVDLA